MAPIPDQDDEFNNNAVNNDEALESNIASATNESPGILSEIERIDPATFSAQILAEEQKRNPVIHLVSKRTKPAREQIAFGTEISQVSHTTPVALPISNPIDQVPVSTPSFKPVVPAPQVVSHPLQPIAYQQPTNNTPVVESKMIDDLDFELQKLPPMILAAPPTQLIPQSHIPPTDLLELTDLVENEDSIQWKTNPIRQVSWEQEINAPTQTKQESEIQDEVVQLFPPHAEAPVPDDFTQPISEDFTSNDFYVAGWCDKSECQQSCHCKTKVIASEITELPALPGVIPATFQSGQSPNTSKLQMPDWQVPEFDLELKPLRSVPLRVDNEPSLALPGFQSGSATRCRFLPNRSVRITIRFDFLRQPVIK